MRFLPSFARWGGVAAAVLLGGCATVVQPPRAPVVARPVFLLDYAGHASLVLQDENGTMTQYSYGDWRWYALDRADWLMGAAALFWPSRAALGRREWPASRGAGPEMWWPGADECFEIRVEGRKVEQLQGRLERLYRENLHTSVFNPSRGLCLVEHPRPYSASHNSNTMAADWLEELGCVVDRGWTLLGQWEVRSAAED